eukprot:SM000013S26398  [mRNA]  locus=s13:167482:173942:- [translate_table: standard]
MVGYRTAVHGEHGERAAAAAAADGEEHHGSDDERSIAADSWSVKSEYGSTLDGEDTRTAEVMEVMATVEDDNNGLEDGEGRDAGNGSVLGQQSHWDAVYADDLATFHERGEPGEIWFGESVMEIMVEWTTRVAAALAAGLPAEQVRASSVTACSPPQGRQGVHGSTAGDAAAWRVLDLGTGNGLLLHALSKHGFKDLTGSDYSEAAIELARAVAQRHGHHAINFHVDNILDSRLEGQYELVTDKGTLDAVGLHQDGASRKKMYMQAVERLIAPGGLLVITSCNLTKEELIAEFCNIDSPTSTTATRGFKQAREANGTQSMPSRAAFELVDFVRSYPSFRFGGSEGSRLELQHPRTRRPPVQARSAALAIFVRKELWRLPAASLVFSSTPETLVGLYLVYFFRVFERQLGSNKYAVFTIFATVLSTLLELLALTLLRDPESELTIAPGPYGLLFASFVPFFFDIPVSTRFTIFGAQFSDKSFVYLGGLQVLLSSYKRSIIPGLCGLLAGAVYRSNFLRIKQVQFPELVAIAAARLFAPVISQPLHSPLHRPHRPPPPGVAANSGPGQGFQDQLIGGAPAAAVQPHYAGRLAASAPPLAPPPPPSAEALATLEAMGFPRDLALRALAQARNDLNVATNILLESTAS